MKSRTAAAAAAAKSKKTGAERRATLVSRIKLHFVLSAAVWRRRLFF